MDGRREEYKAGGDRSSDALRGHSLSRQSQDRTPFWSEDWVEVKGLSSGWLLCFSDLSAFTPNI